MIPQTYFRPAPGIALRPTVTVDGAPTLLRPLAPSSMLRTGMAAVTATGTFIWDASSFDADDGTTVIKPNDVLVSGRWKKQASGSLPGGSLHQHLEYDGADWVAVTDLIFPNNANVMVKLADAIALPGNSLTIQGQMGDGAGNAGGSLNLYAGNSGPEGNGGALEIGGGTGAGPAGNGGQLTIRGGIAAAVADASGNGGDVHLQGGWGQGTSCAGGALWLQGGTGSNVGGFVQFKGGNTATTYGAGGDAELAGGDNFAGESGGAHGGNVSVHGGDGYAGGTLNLAGGSASGDGVAGGHVQIVGGAAPFNTNDGGHVEIRGGSAYTGGYVMIYPGDSSGIGSTTPYLRLLGGTPAMRTIGGVIELFASDGGMGDGAHDPGDGGGITIAAGSSGPQVAGFGGAMGGSLLLRAGNGTGGRYSGDIYLRPGTVASGGVAGKINIGCGGDNWTDMDVPNIIRFGRIPGFHSTRGVFEIQNTDGRSTTASTIGFYSWVVTDFGLSSNATDGVKYTTGDKTLRAIGTGNIVATCVETPLVGDIGVVANDCVYVKASLIMGTAVAAKAIADGVVHAKARAIGVYQGSDLVRVAGSAVVICEEDNIVGEEVFLSPTTAGRVTNVVPSTSGQFITSIGVVTKANSGGAGGTATVILSIARPLIVLSM